MAQDILVDEQIKPGLELIEKFDRFMPVKVAFWLKEAGRSDGPRLFIASDSYDDDRFDAAHIAAFRLAEQVGGYGLNPMDVRVIRGDDRRVPDAINYQKAQAGRRPRAWGPSRVADVWADDFYVYPPLHEQALAAG